MATTPEEEYEGRTHIGEQARQIVEPVRQAVAGSRDASALLIVLMIVTAISLTFAPAPWAQIGVGFLIWFAYRVGWKRV